MKYDYSKYFALRYGEYETYNRNAYIYIKDIDMLDKYLSSLKNIVNANEEKENKKIGLLLSGGMDSAILAKYVDKNNTIAFTFKYDNNFAEDEYNNAKKYAEINGLQLIDVPISWETIKDDIIPLMRTRHGPISTIEPQLYEACKLAKKNYGINKLIIGGDADVVFGGMDKMLTRDWKSADDFLDFYCYLKPELILKPEYINNSYKKIVNSYWNPKTNKFDIVRFIDNIYETESTKAYWVAFDTAKCQMIDPFTALMYNYDIELIKKKPKYIIQDLFVKLYGFKPPEKKPMPRPVDFYEALNEYPKNEMFREDIDFSKLTGQQKWLIYCADKYATGIN